MLKSIKGKLLTLLFIHTLGLLVCINFDIYVYPTGYTIYLDLSIISSLPNNSFLFVFLSLEWVGLIYNIYFKLHAISYPLLYSLIVCLIITEGYFIHAPYHFVIMKRRLDIPDAPWESHTYMFLDQVEDLTLYYDEYHNSYFTSDGYFPQSFKEPEEFWELTSRTRWSMELKVHFLRYEMKFYEPFFQKHVIYDSPYYLGHANLFDEDEDYSSLGISLTSGSAQDASSYIWDIEYPILDPLTKQVPMDLWPHPTELYQNSFYPEEMDVSLKHFLNLEEYPLNISEVSIKRNWSDNPTSYYFRI